DRGAGGARCAERSLRGCRPRSRGGAVMAAAASTRTVLPDAVPLGITLDDAHIAHEPSEARGLRRDEVRLLVSPGSDAPVHARFRDLPAHLRKGDLLVVN